MPELVFKGKEYVYNHHLTVPYRPLVPDAERSIGTADMAGDLVIQGDNLHALKSLLPHYAGKVDLVIIDPPYNTGNESWSYNDNVNSPLMQEWLRSNPVGAEDMLRHDKWLCMMWPRLTLLRELLSKRGSIWMTLDDNEVHRARGVMDEIFGDGAFLANISWEKRHTRSNNARRFYSLKDSLLVYRKSDELDEIKKSRTEKADSNYSNPDADLRGEWMTSSYVNPATKEARPNLVYPVTRPTDGAVVQHPTHAWKYSRTEHKRHVKDGLLWWGEDGLAEYPRLKLFLKEASQLVPVDVWRYPEVGTTDEAGAELKEIFGAAVFDTPKPVRLVEKILGIASTPGSLVLDSFAGSGTTAHAVLKTNAEDGGSRRFILVECEEYADTLTAERVRRVIDGYAFAGNQREELLREKITWTTLRKADALVRRAEALRAKHAPAESAGELLPTSAKRFDKVDIEVTGGELVVTGVRRISEKVEGLGGEFTYCTLGEALDAERLLSGEQLPDFLELGAWLFHVATGVTLNRNKARAKDFYLGDAGDRSLWMIYRPDLDFLKSTEAALTLSRAKNLREQHGERRHLVFAPAKFVSNKQLLTLGVEYGSLPYALFEER